ncbi:Flp family type IVb pilin [Basilea psittacipulmonis]|uniref:Fimbrial protein n=1 Tax=Basilea psittacipulmonis DSM 24701 TaxID=1072685 RepID=A0A077DDZ0_9BURK|nr:Flp family type IVb pilin [Basilea psittacipulmonis]AIL32356.1 fimbrial protein [Basilea psittacipulmonis DSM 24701]
MLTKAYIALTEGLRSFRKNTEGVTAIEYGLIAVAVAVLIVAVFYNKDGFIVKLQSKFGDLTNNINNASTAVKGS